MVDTDITLVDNPDDFQLNEPYDNPRMDPHQNNLPTATSATTEGMQQSESIGAETVDRSSAESNESENSQQESQESLEEASVLNQELNQPSTAMVAPADRNAEEQNRTIVQTVATIIKSILHFTLRALSSLFQKPLSTTQLYALSIVLLSAHMTVQKVVELVPYALWRIFLWIGGDKITKGGNDIELESLLKIRDQMGGGFAGDVKILERILEFVLLSDSTTQFESASIFSRADPLVEELARVFESSSYANVGSSSGSVLHFLEAPVLSIMLPTTIMSIFLLITMTIFLLMHMLFQIFLYLSGSLSQSSPFSSGTFYMWGIMCILTLEAVVPWLCFGIGVYVSVAVGGTTWCIFLVGTILLWSGLRALRMGVYRRIQDWNTT